MEVDKIIIVVNDNHLFIPGSFVVYLDSCDAVSERVPILIVEDCNSVEGFTKV